MTIARHILQVSKISDIESSNYMFENSSMLRLRRTYVVLQDKAAFISYTFSTWWWKISPKLLVTLTYVLQPYHFFYVSPYLMMHFIWISVNSMVLNISMQNGWRNLKFLSLVQCMTMVCLLLFRSEILLIFTSPLPLRYLDSVVLYIRASKF